MMRAIKCREKEIYLYDYAYWLYVLMCFFPTVVQDYLVKIFSDSTLKNMTGRKTAVN